MPATQKRAGDVTGRKSEQLAEENADELARRKDELSTIAQAVAAENGEVVDLTAPQAVEVPDEPAEALPPTVVIRVNETIEDMTFGVGNHYTFEKGKRYRVPRTLAEHLEEKGLLWH